MGVVYKLTFPDGKSYIGSTTKSLAVRLKSHKYDCKANPHMSTPMQSAVLKFGIDSVSSEILTEIQDVLELRSEESRLIHLHNTFYPFGYNFSASTGRAGRFTKVNWLNPVPKKPMSESHKKAISEGRKKRRRM